MTPAAVFVRQRGSGGITNILARSVPCSLSCQLRSRHRPVLTVARSASGQSLGGYRRLTGLRGASSTGHVRLLLTATTAGTACTLSSSCLLYASDAADDLTRVD